MDGRHLLFLGACVVAGCNALSGATNLVPETIDEADASLSQDAAADTTYTTTPIDAAHASDPVDASSSKDASVPEEAGPPPPLRVFVSKTLVTGPFGGVAGADTQCQNFASAKGFGTNWTAWVSDSSANATDRITADGPWALVDGTTLVAANKAQLVSGTLLHAIDHDEDGTAVAASSVWTGTAGNGSLSTPDCQDWKSGGLFNGTVGSTGAVDTSWTLDGDKPACKTALHLYCFEE